MTPRPCTIVGDVCFVPLTQGKVAVVDATDFDLVSMHNWYASKGRGTYYASRKRRCGGSKKGRIGLHRALLGEPNSHIDHVDRNGLNCRRSNLRCCTPSQNQANKNGYGSASGFKGVTANGGKWAASICADGCRMHLGRFGSESDAARAYDRAASEYFGEFAWLNFPEEMTVAS